MPGLLRGVARTAAIAGTATAVSGRVARRQAEKYTDRDAQIAADRQAAYDQATAPAAAPVAAAPAPAAAPEADLMDHLQKLGDLKAQGILTEEEFAAQKAKLLGS